MASPLARLLAPDPTYARLVWPLATAQLVSWGSVYYAFTLFLEPMERDLGLPRTTLTGALMVGLLVAGACAVPVGALIDKGRGRWVMTAGSLGAAALMLAWSRVETAAGFMAVWCGLGVVLATTLYEPAFAVLVRTLGPGGRRAIAVTTLMGGLASTVFLPLIHLLIVEFGWRGALVGLALCNLVICVPIHLFCLREPAVAGRPTPAERGTTRGRIGAAVAQPAFWLLAAAFTASLFSVAAIVFHIVPLLSARGHGLGAIVAAMTLLGPAQVAGRLLLTAVAADAGLVLSGMMALGPMLLALVLLLMGFQGFWSIALFTVLLGFGNGILTIVRATAVEALFGSAGFGAVSGTMMMPVVIARATAPAAIAWVWAATGGYATAEWLLAAMAVLALVCYLAGIAAARPLARES